MFQSKLARAIDTRPIYVFILTPLGLGGQGGIDRFMDYLRSAFHTNSDVKCIFVTTRGKGHIVLSPIFLAIAIARITVYKILGRIDVAHINLASDGSTYRKLIIAWVLRTFRIPYVIHLHGDHFHRFWDHSPHWLDIAIKDLFTHSARIIVLGTVWAELVHRKTPAAITRIVVLPPATPAVPYNRREREHQGSAKIVFLGQLGKRKGVPELVSALESVSEVMKHAQCDARGA